MVEKLSSDKARINRFVCKKMTGGRVRCEHEDLDVSMTVGTDEAKIYSREQGMDIEVDHSGVNERSWR